jgi:tRNA(Ile)-lysidine synthase
VIRSRSIEAAVATALTDTPGRIVVAFSGGMDSTVLLHAVVESVDDRSRVLALHVNHGLSVRADEWQRHCESVCSQLGVKNVHRRVSIGSDGGTEAAARKSRYGAFREFLAPGDALWLAHHRDDQAETLLWKLMRGGGVAALAGMPESRLLGAGHLRRPLLAVPRIEIAAWANARGLMWIDDDSNVDARFDRNFIRHEVLPVLQAKWPDAASRLQHAARRFADEAVLVREALDRRLEEFGVDGARIAVAVAADPQALPLLRRWLESNGVTGVRERVLMEIVRQAGGALDRLPQVAVAAARTVRRFADHLYLVSQAKTRFETGNWKLGEPLSTPAGLLRAELGSGVGLRSAIGFVQVRPRSGGERLRPVRREGSRTVKQLLHDARVPPWLRDGYPLVYVDDALAAVPGIAIDEAFAEDGDRVWKLSVEVDAPKA